MKRLFVLMLVAILFSTVAFSDVVVPVPRRGNLVIPSSDLNAATTDDVKLTGNQTVSGTKTFTSAPKSTVANGTDVNELMRANYFSDRANCKVVYPTDNIVTSYAWLASSDRDSAMGTKSTSNRRTLIVMPGVYTPNTAITLSKYVDIFAYPGAILNATTYSNQTYALPIVAVKQTEVAGGVTNYITGLTITGGQSCFGFYGNGASGDSSEATYRPKIVVSNCKMDGTIDVVYWRVTSTPYSVNYDIYFNNCSFYGNYDTVYLAAGMTKMYFSDCQFHSLWTSVNTANICRNVAMNVHASSSYTATVYLDNCDMLSVVDTNDVAGAQAVAHNTYTYNANNNIYLTNCRLTSYARKNATGTNLEGDAVVQGYGITSLEGCKILSVTGGYDLKQTYNGEGQLRVDSTTSYNKANISGTITFAGLINADPNSTGTGLGGTTGTGVTPSGTVGVYINGVRYWILTSATQNAP